MKKHKYTQLPHGLHRPLHKQNQHRVSELHTWAHRTTSGHRGHKMGSKWLVNLLQRKNPRLQRSGCIPRNYSRKRSPDGKAQASSQWTEADGEMPMTTSCEEGWPLGDSLPPLPMDLPSRQVRLYPDFTFLPCSETCRCHGIVMHVQHPTDKVPRWHGGRGLGLSKDKSFSKE